MYICVSHVCLEPMEVIRGHQIPWSYIQLYTDTRLQAALWVLGIKSRSSGRATRAFNHCTISLQPLQIFFFKCKVQEYHRQGWYSPSQVPSPPRYKQSQPHAPATMNHAFSTTRDWILSNCEPKRLNCYSLKLLFVEYLVTAMRNVTINNNNIKNCTEDWP